MTRLDHLPPCLTGLALRWLACNMQLREPLHTSRAAAPAPPALKKNASAPRRPQSTMNTLYIACLVAQVAAVPVR